MARRSETGNVKKRCGCSRAKWSTCPHPWHVDFKAPKDHPRRGNERYRKNLDDAIGFHPATLTEAKNEAHRAITAWLDGKDAGELQASDRPTLAQVLAAYRRRPDASPSEKEQVNSILTTPVQGRRFGDWRAADISREALIAFQQQRPRVAGNRNLALLRAMFNWAVVAGLVPNSPFRIGHVTVVKLRPELARTRRLQPGEEDRLLAAARGLAPLITAALETGCRLGELLSLQWAQVRVTPRAELFLPAQKTKAKKDRRVPISSTLLAVLEARRYDPAGEGLPADAFVFGDEIGRRRYSVKTAWRLTCQRAGITGLHFHDLRREAGSRWMDAGVPLGTIQRWLGHHNISQTSTYLSASLGSDADEMRAYEQRLGRVTQRDIFSGSDGSERIQTDRPVFEKPQQSTFVSNPTGTVQ